MADVHSMGVLVALGHGDRAYAWMTKLMLGIRRNVYVIGVEIVVTRT